MIEALILGYLAVGLAFAMHAWNLAMARGRTDIPYYAFIIAVFIWPYTMALTIKIRRGK